MTEKYALAPIGFSYFDGSAAHFDLVQWATDPIWSEIEDLDRRGAVIDADTNFLRALLGMGSWNLVIVNGLQVHKAMREQGSFSYLS